MHERLALAVGSIVVVAMTSGCDAKFVTNALGGGTEPVAGVKTTRSADQADFDHAAEMTGSRPGEVRGFESEDRTDAYAFKPDGNSTVDPLPLHLAEKEESRTPPVRAPSPVAERLAKEPAPAADGSRRRRPQRRADAKRQLAPSGTASSSMSPGSAKVVGNVPALGQGLPLDD